LQGIPENLEVIEAFLEELEHGGYIKIELGLLNDKDSVAFYTLTADEETIRSNYFRPQQKISHHVGRFPISIQSIRSDTSPIVCRARNTTYCSIQRYFGWSIGQPESNFDNSKPCRIQGT
jgi:hypothetical protein